MCVWETSTAIHVIRRNHPGIADGHHEIHVDSCLAEYVQTMNDLGIITLACCCGHGRAWANILVAIKSKGLLEQHGYIYWNYCDTCYTQDNYHALIHYPNIEEERNA